MQSVFKSFLLRSLGVHGANSYKQYVSATVNPQEKQSEIQPAHYTLCNLSKKLLLHEALYIKIWQPKSPQMGALWCL